MDIPDFMKPLLDGTAYVPGDALNIQNEPNNPISESIIDRIREWQETGNKRLLLRAKILLEQLIANEGR
jgi:hypothetical protein